MLKAMLSQPMAGKTKEEINETRNRAIATLECMGFEVVNTLFTDEWYSEEAMKERGVENRPLMFFAKSVENMANCHAAYFCKGWENARGCRLEHAVAEAYGLDIYHEEDIVPADFFPEIKLSVKSVPGRDELRRAEWSLVYNGGKYGSYIDIYKEASSKEICTAINLLCEQATQTLNNVMRADTARGGEK